MPYLPASLGVPLRLPPAESVNPGGRTPSSSDHDALASEHENVTVTA